jgi:nicotinate phosphoribosyltransferase
VNIKRNLTMMTDFYQITMLQGYFDAGKANDTVVFDMFYRKNPFDNGYVTFCGLQQVIEYIQNIKFEEEDISYLRSLNMFSEPFLNYLKNFKFTGTIYSMEEGTPVFPNEPLVRVKAKRPQAQFIETALLNIINHQSLIATKASRVKQSCGNDILMDFGVRRAQGPDAAILGSRACYIAGGDATANVLAGRDFGIPVKGTHAHSWVMSFDTELESFRAYAKAFPNYPILLVDTYNTLKSGVPNAIKVFEELREEGKVLNTYGIRLDSGDLAHLSKVARKMLDEAGFEDAIISASNDLDENIIADLKLQGSRIDLWGVGTNLITAKDCPAMGGVYKLVAEFDEYENITSKIKLSDNEIKISNPGFKKVYRIYDKKTRYVLADYITLEDEVIDTSKDLILQNETHGWKKTKLEANSYTVRDLLVKIFEDGELVYEIPHIRKVRRYCIEQKYTLWPEVKRFINPHIIPVDISNKIYDIKKKLIHDAYNHED